MNDDSASLTLADLLPRPARIDPAEMSLGRARRMSATMLGFVGAKVEEAVAASLDVDVLGLIAEAWAKTDELRDAAAEGRRRGEPQHLYLARHDVECENHIQVLIELAGSAALGAVLAPVTDELTLVLKAKFEGVGLTIDRGFIVAIDAGQGAAQAELRYASTKLVGSTTDWLALPARCTLPHPIAIASEPKVVALRREAAAA